MSVFTVSQLNRSVQEVIGVKFGPEVWVVGEVHGLKLHAKSGHLYFDLVEKSADSTQGYLAKIGCAFFRGSVARWEHELRQQGLARFTLKDGLEVKLKARIDVYVKEGRYQLIVAAIDAAHTLGAIAQRRAATIKALKDAGLWDRNRSLGMPSPPLNIGLITSVGSAAYNDFMSIVRHSGYAFRLQVFDAYMQGANTSREVSAGIRRLAQSPGLELIVVIRGGGARTDLMYFDELALCTAIAESPLPVITGIGHEIDLAVADMVARRHFVTPTDVARFLVGVLDEVWARLATAGDETAAAARRALAAAGARVYTQGDRLAHLARNQAADAAHRQRGLLFRMHTQTLQALGARRALLQRLQDGLHSAAGRGLRAAAAGLALAGARAAVGMPAALAVARRQVASQAVGVRAAAEVLQARQREGLGRLAELVRIMDPAETLKRGFSITLDARGRVLTDAGQVAVGERLTTRLLAGRVTSRVEETDGV